MGRSMASDFHALSLLLLVTAATAGCGAARDVSESAEAAEGRSAPVTWAGRSDPRPQQMLLTEKSVTHLPVTELVVVEGPVTNMAEERENHRWTPKTMTNANTLTVGAPLTASVAKLAVAARCAQVRAREGRAPPPAGGEGAGRRRGRSYPTEGNRMGR